MWTPRTVISTIETTKSTTKTIRANTYFKYYYNYNQDFMSSVALPTNVLEIVNFCLEETVEGTPANHLESLGNEDFSINFRF